MINDLVRELAQATLAGTAAVVFLLCVRRPLRARFGARAAYQAWLLVPLAILAVFSAGAAGARRLGRRERTGNGGRRNLAVDSRRAGAGIVAGSIPAGCGLGCGLAAVAVLVRLAAAALPAPDGTPCGQAGSRSVSGHGPAVVGLVALADRAARRLPRALHARRAPPGARA
jgi:hypothetical protein